MSIPALREDGKQVRSYQRSTDAFLDTRQCLLDCINCERSFDPIATRWLCPYCKYKSSCCEGAPL